MTSFNSKCLILSFAVFGGCSVNAYSDMHWDEFLKKPDEDSFVELEDEISVSAERCNWGNPKNRDVVSVEAEQQLFRLIANGDEFALRAGLLVMRCLDGGELEDFHRSAGLFFESKPSVFLKIAEEKKVPNAAIKSMLTMLPLDTVDNIDRALSVIEKRMAMLKAISDSRFDNLKKAGLSFLGNQKVMLGRVKNERITKSN